jgi:4-methylaminobutanoate oxidase (formaldehyde-forming)
VERLPFASPDGLVGGLWIPDDGRVDPTNLTMAYARAAARRGVSVVEDMPVRRILVEGGRVKGVETVEGRIACEAVVLAAGLWSSALARTCGVRLPLVALHHFYLLTKPIPGIDRDLPLFLSYDEKLYGREDVGGLLVGVFDDRAIPVEPEELPGEFVFSLLPGNWDQIAPNLPVLTRRFPLLERVEIRSLVNGPESFTPDGNMLLGEVPGVRGLFVCTGMNSNGIALAAGAGRLAAEWLVRGQPSLDATKLDIRRFMPFESGRTYRHRRMGEQFEVLCRAPAPDRDYRRTRGIRRMPLHEAHRTAGAVFVARAGWETPAWFGPGAWAACVRAELAAAATGLAVHDRSADAKLLIEAVDAGGSARLQPLPTPGGGIAALPWALPLAPDRLLLTAEPEDETRLAAACREHWTGSASVGPGWAAFDLFGPLAEPALARLAGGAALPGPGEIRAVELGFAPCHLARLPALGAWRVLCTADFAAGLHESLLAEGAEPIGTLAAESLRVRAGLPRFGREASLTLAPEQVRPFTLMAPGWAGDLAGEPVLAAGRIVGHVTSSAHVDMDGRVALLACLVMEVEDHAVVVDGSLTPIVA